MNRNGEPVARSEWNPASQVFTIEAEPGQSWKEILRSKDEGTRELYGLTSDEKSIVISSKTSSGRSGLWTLPLDGSSEGTPLLDDENYDVSGISYDRITRAPVSASLGGAEQELRWLDKDAEKRFRRVAGAFKGKRVAVYGRSEDGQRVLAQVDAPSSPPVYYFVDFCEGHGGYRWRGLSRAHRREARRSAGHQLRRARRGDGAGLSHDLRRVPMARIFRWWCCLMAAPKSRDDYAFDWWAQFLAVRGYAVLQPQFRGSTGFGAAWEPPAAGNGAA